MSAPFLLLTNVTCYPSVIVSVNLAVLVVKGEKITMDRAHHSNQVNSVFLFSTPLLFLWHEKQATSWGEPEAYCGAGHCWLDESRIQVTFLIELFVSAFQHDVFSPALLKTITRDETPFYHSSQSRWAILRRWIVCVCLCLCCWKQCPSFCGLHEHKGAYREERGFSDGVYVWYLCGCRPPCMVLSEDKVSRFMNQLGLH